MFGEIAGGFAEGFAQSSTKAQEQKRLRDVMQFEREEFDYRKKQDLIGHEESDRTHDFEVDREASIEKHRQFTDDIAKQGELIRKREADLKVIESLGQIFDSTKPVGWRKFVLKQLGISLEGVDPKSEQFKDLDKLITTGLDPDSLKEASKMIMGQIPEMQPGQATAMATGLLRGDVTLQEIWKQAEGPPMELKEIADPDSSTGRRLVSEQDAQNQEAPAPAPAISIDQKTESAESVGLAEVDVAEIKTISENATRGREARKYLTTTRAAIESGRFVTGSGAGVMKTLSGWATYVGMDAEGMGLGAKATADTIEAGAGQVSAAMAEQLGRVTNLGIELTQRAGPSLFKTPGGNLLLLDLQEMSINREIAIDDLRKSDYRKTLYPEGKPTFWEARDRLIDDYAEEDAALEKRIKTESVRGDAIPWDKIPGVGAVSDALTEDVPSSSNKWKGIRRRNKTTGETQEWDGTKWVPTE